MRLAAFECTDERMWIGPPNETRISRLSIRSRGRDKEKSEKWEKFSISVAKSEDDFQLDGQEHKWNIGFSVYS